ncbi:reticulon-1-A-like isoform X5 [Biomphalaria glabrata]|uniref:Reticulon-like protein n=1 Tax=Biomphalaria glabrata TaxID=6526 RepID=A0A2C9L725_BIOGL|nr:reticulon-1-A-like isoform X5 [Biomphalaria glabrata]
MASTNPSNQFDNQPESSGYGNDDFEKLDPPGSGFEHDNLEGEELDYQSGIGSSDEVQLRAKKIKCKFQRKGIYKSLVDFGSWLKGVDPRGEKKEDSTQFLKDLIYWRDVKKTGVVFGSLLLILVSLAIFSVLSVIAYLSLAVLTVTFSFVVYKKIMAAVQKSNDGHPFKPFLEMDISLSESKLKSVIQSVLKNVNCLTHELRRLFLIEDIVDSIKFGLLLWVLTYIGSWFSGMFLIILDIVLLFTVPKVYETYQVQIDNYIGLAKAQVNNIITIIQSKLPFLKKKDKSQ